MTWKSSRLQSPKPPPGKPITPEQLAASGTEDGNQAALFCWAALNTEQYPQLKNLFAIPNGGNRHIVEAIKFVGTGTRSGVPDICLAWPVKFKCSMVTKYHGLYIELKINKYRISKNGGCSNKQLEWHERLRNSGYCVKICYGWEEARDSLLDYLMEE